MNAILLIQIIAMTILIVFSPRGQETPISENARAFVEDTRGKTLSFIRTGARAELFGKAFTVPDLPPGDYEVQLRKNGGNRKSAITYEKVLHAAGAAPF